MIREKMEYVDQLWQKYTLKPCSFQQTLNARGEKCTLQSEEEMKGNVWAAVWIVFSSSAKQGLLGVHACSSNRTPVWSLALLFRLVYNVPEGVALSLDTGYLVFYLNAYAPSGGNVPTLTLH